MTLDERGQVEFAHFIIQHADRAKSFLISVVTFVIALVSKLK